MLTVHPQDAHGIVEKQECVIQETVSAMKVLSIQNRLYFAMNNIHETVVVERVIHIFIVFLSARQYNRLVDR